MGHFENAQTLLKHAENQTSDPDPSTLLQIATVEATLAGVESTNEVASQVAYASDLLENIKDALQALSLDIAMKD